MFNQNQTSCCFLILILVWILLSADGAVPVCPAEGWRGDAGGDGEAQWCSQPARGQDAREQEAKCKTSYLVSFCIYIK